MKAHKPKICLAHKLWNASTIIIMILCATIMCPPVDTVAAGCSCPELGKLLEDSRDLLGLKDDAQPMARGTCLQPIQKDIDFQWFGVAIEEPVGGALYALDCSGKVLGTTKIGFVVKLSKYPPLNDIQEVVRVDYLAKVAEGYGLQKVALVAYQNNKIRELWSHDSFEANFKVPAQDGTESTYSIQSSPDGKTISVTGKRKIYPSRGGSFIPDNITTQNLKHRTFCWDSKGAFEECGDR